MGAAVSTEFLERLKAGRPNVDWDAELAAAREWRERQLGGIDVTPLASAMNELASAMARALQPVLDYVAKLLHDFHRVFFPKRHGRCHTCHPRRKPKPLAVDGHAYQQRLRNRRKRRRR
jgi:hypothetical protein